MRAILPGRPQSTRQAVCTAQWDGLRLVAYVSGNTAIVLRDHKDIVQTITVDHVEALSAITIDESSGRLALCDEKRALIFDAVGRDEGDLRWVQAQDIPAHEGGTIRTLSWGSPEELLVGGTQLWLYYVPRSEDARLIWQQSCANEVVMARFSNDAEIIATCGQHDRLVKIWRRLSFELDSTRFDVSYLPHPGTVTNLHWRKPWHAEQNLDNLLYTFCCDSQIRVWSYSDPHSLSLVQLIATIDTGTSIEPRRRSVGSVSRKRYAFIMDSRDFSQATEKAIQQSQNGQVDHALEHLIEIANRSPEICVVLDGVGHMSVWGLENAGCKSKLPAAVFNVTLVDDVDIQLGFPHAEHDDYIQFCTFAGGTSPASLSLLVHSYTGQVDWYESSIADFLDTSTRQNRLTLVSSWSGHDSRVDHIARGLDGTQVLSWADDGQAILWLQTETGALRRQCEIDAAGTIFSVLLLDAEEHLLLLQSSAISLWDLRHAYGRKVCTASLTSDNSPRSIHRIFSSSQTSRGIHFSITFKDGTHEVWQVRIPQNRKQSSMMNGIHASLTSIHNVPSEFSKIGKTIVCDVVSGTQGNRPQTSSVDLAAIDKNGQVRGFGQFSDASSHSSLWRRDFFVNTNIRNSSLTRVSSSGTCAIVAEDGHTLHIWDLVKRAYEWQYKFPGLDQIQKIAWVSTPGAKSLLFVCSSYYAVVIGQLRFSASATKRSAWCVLQRINLRDFTTISVGDVCWLSDGNLVIGAGNQIHVLESTITRSDDPLARRSDHAADNKLVMAVTEMSNSGLPVFHADLTEALVMEGSQQHAERILRLLYEKLKYFSEGDELSSDLDVSSFSLATSWADMSNGQETPDGDTVAELQNVKSSFKEYIDKAEIWQLGARKQYQDISTVLETVIALGKHSKSLDSNGLRYLFALYSTPKDQDLPWKAYVFASRSTSQEALLDLVNQYSNGKLTWKVARRTGLFVWLSDRAALQVQFENVARAEYTNHEDRNPVDCSLHYLALNKKSVLQGLWRMTIGVREKENTMKLLANNFGDPKWRATALKNAYALLSKRRFEYGAAFFLLAGSLKDAVNVCVNQLHDVQLAVAITRVWDRDIEQSEQVLDYLLRQYVLSISVDSEDGRWMAAWAYTALDQLEDALRVLVRPVYQITATNLSDYKGPVKSMSFRANDPHLTILYAQIRDSLAKQGRWTTEIITPREEWDFVVHAAMWWTRAGMDLLALRLTRNWKFIAYQGPRAPAAVTTMVTVGEAAATPESEVAVPQEQQPEDMEPSDGRKEKGKDTKKKPPPTQFVEPSADSLLDSFGF